MSVVRIIEITTFINMDFVVSVIDISILRVRLQVINEASNKIICTDQKSRSVTGICDDLCLL